ncbi:hypothetical protein GURASL_08180 [Geotalea uraniireducens]|uniref:Uncharacterized protein n=1 Tax=Geotalea uraniireducens TaxID=351604 RepID=A0ABN6VV31_9BACT|nr:hypothetical protein GURASL_08180 [Geotalea uraniireducens]
MAGSPQRRADIFEPERFDPKERPETEPVITGMGAKQQYVHGYLDSRVPPILPEKARRGQGDTAVPGKNSFFSNAAKGRAGSQQAAAGIPAPAVCFCR